MKLILVDAINTFVIPGKGINYEMHQLLENYPHKKIILTNANDEECIKFGLDKMPYEIFTLKHNPDKIDPKYYKSFLKNNNFKTQDLIYFEHNLEAVESARSLGIKTFHYNKDKMDLDGLKQFLDSNL